MIAVRQEARRAGQKLAGGVSPRNAADDEMEPRRGDENKTSMSYTSMNYHVVFSTKDRRPFLQDDLLPRVCQYAGGMVRELNGVLLEANGQPDHLHLALVIPPTLAVSDFIGKVKAYASGWIHRALPDLEAFKWQDGYAAFTVSPSALDKVIAYIRGQQEHHKTLSFEEELMSLLDKHGIEYDPAKLRA